MNPGGILIRVVDDDASFRTAVSRFLRASGFPVKAFASGAEFLAQPDPDVPGCLLLDLEMPEGDGLALQDVLRKQDNPLPVIFLSGRGDIPRTVRAMRQGAEDFLTKECSGETLLETVRRAVARDLAERTRRAHRAEIRARFDSLSEREQEVLRHVVRGKLNKEIAADLGIHERTVKLHRTHITTKLQVHSVAELTRLVQESGLGERPPEQTFPKGQ